MARPPAPWLARGYECLADGHWHDRDDILNKMVRHVPPGVAYRRGVATNHGRQATDQLLIERGARHICLVALAGSTRLETEVRGDDVWLRLQDLPATPRPLIFDRTEDEDEATHVVVPLHVYYQELVTLADAMLVRERA